MFPSQVLLLSSVLLAAFTVASPNPYIKIEVTIDDATTANDATPISPNDQDFIDWYNCKGVTNGNYYHPCDCHKFITCSNGYASERNCAACMPDPVKCPDGRTSFDEPSE